LKGCNIQYRFRFDDRRGSGGISVKSTPIAASMNLSRARQAQDSRPTGIAARQIPFDASIDADHVNYRLEEAGATLLALPGSGWSTRLRSSSLEIVRSSLEAYGWDAAKIRPAVPSAEKIDRMDEALAWILMIPLERYVLRRIVGARSLVHPITDRHLFPWRRLGVVLGTDHKAVQRWHAQGIAIIVAGLQHLG
jgi:hypothetical protein